LENFASLLRRLQLNHYFLQMLRASLFAVSTLPLHKSTTLHHTKKNNRNPDHFMLLAGTAPIIAYTAETCRIQMFYLYLLQTYH